jgi:hypothetical protein
LQQDAVAEGDATLVAEPSDAIDICVTGPYGMLVRPLGQ